MSSHKCDNLPASISNCLCCVFSLTYAKTGAAIVRLPQATAFQVFDQKTLHLLEPRYATSKPIHADTLPELAQKMGVDAANFAETIRQYNAATPHDAVEKFNAFALDHVSTGTALAIPKSNWALPIDQGPYVAYGVTCGITFTYGGLRTDDAAHVLNEEGLVMPGLWAVGEIAGGFFAFNYPGGSGLTKGAVFGKIAGEAAAERAKTLRG
ncbi:succinate dehydrogenase/fumarate reductase flavo protein [Aspergillus uvarum CBS 121591]|uniref:Succinate dehydrogenase/fumarate reductase flavo protein n=1 Tax=Aspergillus uvarum CBS 121591 TaxID=1448315 RepID=A0A319E529_9EURO|nr:succinate dehydrogenase/fumarate reductase flavo protein [Aspergillus uvarum CBS 121591]PYH86212.1 succinate dehydrogenase/fumarate reductase flavo protein [Aspergillus uvarum CBS 121591]